MSEVILQGQGLTRRYATESGGILTACSDIDLTLYRGKTLGIVGESGCGKSTLLRLLMQLEHPDEGKILFRDKDVTNLKGEALRQSRRNIQMVLQDPSTAFFPTIREGDVPSPLNAPKGCPFHTRCVNCMERCTHEAPAMRSISRDHQVACHQFD